MLPGHADKETEDEAEEMKALNEDEELPLTLCAGGLLDKAALRLSEVGFAYNGAKDSLLFTGAGLHARQVGAVLQPAPFTSAPLVSWSSYE